MAQLPQKVDVPKIEVVERVEIPSNRGAVIVVDMQNDFVNPRGKLFVPTAPSTVPKIKTLVEKARRCGVLVIYTKDTHYPNDPEFRLWGEHAVKGTWGWEIVDELKPAGGDIVVEKPRYDAFYGTPLDDILRSYGRGHLVIVGTVANICVLHTVGSAAIRWYRVYVPLDAVSALTDFDMCVLARQTSFLYRGVIVRSVDGIVFV